MSAFEPYAISGAALFGIGVWGLFTHARAVPKILAANIASNGVFLLLVSFAQRGSAAGKPDPVLHALVLTGVVVAVSTTALSLALVKRLSRTAEPTKRAHEVQSSHGPPR
jgi:multicomponent Na+:H+ antiporter subunit C